MRILLATYSKPKRFLENLEVTDDRTVLTVVTRAEHEKDEKILVEIGYPGLPNRILLRAQALAAATGEDEKAQQFVIEEGQEPQRDFLIAVASGRATASYERRHRRFPVRMQARYKVEGEDDEQAQQGSAEVEDMASGGVALKTGESLPDGARVSVVLEPGDGSGDIELSGVVVWHRKDDDTNEVGIQFDAPASDSARRLRQIIRGVKFSGETPE